MQQALRTRRNISSLTRKQEEFHSRIQASRSAFSKVALVVFMIHFCAPTRRMAAYAGFIGTFNRPSFGKSALRLWYGPGATTSLSSGRKRKCPPASARGSSTTSAGDGGAPPETRGGDGERPAGETRGERTAEGRPPVSLYRSEGLFAVAKPLEWTSQDCVAYCRGILERDARSRGAKVAKRRGHKNRKRKVKVCHGGTLDPLATGVLVIGVGSGTKELQSYLAGSKKYRASVELGYETKTLDREGNITKTAPHEHVTLDSIRECLPAFTGKIMQVPPVYSAIRKGGKKLYVEVRKGKTAEELGVEAREVEVYGLDLLPEDDKGRGLPRFGLDVECGGGTYIRSLIRDIGRELDSAATMTSLERTQQGQFTLEDALPKDDWNADNIFAAIDKTNADMGKSSEEDSSKTENVSVQVEN